MTSTASSSRTGVVVKPSPVAQLLSLSEATVDEIVEAIIAWSDQTIGSADIIAASAQFHADNGKVFHDDLFYASRTAYFFDHYVFERRTAVGGTPYELFSAHVRALAEQGPPGEISQAFLDRLTWLGNYRHSVFRIIKLQERSMVVQDLLNPAKIKVMAKPGETLRGLDKKLLLQGFLFRLTQQHEERQLSSGLVLHPAGATRLIRKYLRLWQKDGTQPRRTALARLATLQLSQLRHRHVEPKQIYQLSPERRG